MGREGLEASSGTLPSSELSGATLSCLELCFH